MSASQLWAPCPKSKSRMATRGVYRVDSVAAAPPSRRGSDSVSPARRAHGSDAAARAARRAGVGQHPARRAARVREAAPRRVCRRGAPRARSRAQARQGTFRIQHLSYEGDARGHACSRLETFDTAGDHREKGLMCCSNGRDRDAQGKKPERTSGISFPPGRRTVRCINTVSGSCCTFAS